MFGFPNTFQWTCAQTNTFLLSNYNGLFSKIWQKIPNGTYVQTSSLPSAVSIHGEHFALCILSIVIRQYLDITRSSSDFFLDKIEMSSGTQIIACLFCSFIDTLCYNKDVFLASVSAPNIAAVPNAQALSYFLWELYCK